MLGPTASREPCSKNQAMLAQQTADEVGRLVSLFQKLWQACSARWLQKALATGARRLSFRS